VLSRLSKLAVVAALAGSLGLHWGLLQSVAWLGMVVSYSQDQSLGAAMVKTFDGNHPCALCKEIAKGRQSEKRPESATALKKFEFSYSVAAFVFAAPSQYWEIRWPQEWCAVRAQAPPVPPPRQLPG
jgi:hypothetical protein